MTTDRIDTLLDEQRSFPPPQRFRGAAHVKDRAPYERAARDREGYWADWARQLDWFRPWDRVLEWKPPHAKWFVGGRLNASVNCLDRHVAGPRRTKAAIIWEGEPEGQTRTLTYFDLYRAVNRFAAALRQGGVRKGEIVTIYMPMIPEVAVAVLACARIGAPHSVVFGGFSPESLRDRINDAGSKVVITADGGYRRGSVVPLKRNVDEALKECPTVQRVIVARRTGDRDVPWTEGRDVWWHDFIKDAPAHADPVPMDAEDMLFLLYTSGSTGKPKGVQIPHAAVVNFLNSMRRKPGLTSADTLLAVTTLSFDIAGLELYLPLVTGARLLLASRETAQAGEKLKDILEQRGVTAMQATPATWRLLFGAGWTGDRQLKVLCGGEALPRDLADRLLGASAALWNVYGPTETTIWSA